MPSCKHLRTKVRHLRGVPALTHRLRRSLSWLERGNGARDADAKFVFLWIAFNAAYAIDRKTELAIRGEEVTDAQRRREYFRTLVPYDVDRRIYRQLVGVLCDPVRHLIANVYVYRGFWDCLSDRQFNWQNWKYKTRFERDIKTVESLLGFIDSRGSLQAQLRAKAVVPHEDVVRVLDILFDRLNVLRNQLMHGCATHKGTLNRRQVDPGAQMLASLVLLFLDIMVDHPEQDWGPVPFPVRDDIREDRYD